MSGLIENRNNNLICTTLNDNSCYNSKEVKVLFSRENNNKKNSNFGVERTKIYKYLHDIIIWKIVSRISLYAFRLSSLFPQFCAIVCVFYKWLPGSYELYPPQVYTRPTRFSRVEQCALNPYGFLYYYYFFFVLFYLVETGAQYCNIKTGTIFLLRLQAKNCFFLFNGTAFLSTILLISFRIDFRSSWPHFVRKAVVSIPWRCSSREEKNSVGK